MCGWMVSGAVVVVFFDANAMQAIHENLAGKMTVRACAFVQVNIPSCPLYLSRATVGIFCCIR